MTRFFTITALAALSAEAVLAEDYQAGMAPLIIEDAARPLEGFVWYPTQVSGGAAPVHGNAVWEGVPAIADAAAAEGQFPLVVLSHGMFGNAMNQSWLAADLAGRGYVVATINHPGTSTWARDADDRRMLWERARDVSRVIDALEDDPRVDADRVFMAGHSLGGFTAGLLAGARYDAAGLEAFCAEVPGDLVCEIFQGWNVAQTPEDIAMMESDWSDARIDAFAFFDMGGAQAFSAESMAQMTRPALVYGAPYQNDGSLDLDVQSRAMVAAMPEGAVTYLEPDGLAHMDFLGVCTEAALAILADEEPADVFVCEGGTDERRAEHARIAETVAAFFDAAE